MERKVWMLLVSAIFGAMTLATAPASANSIYVNTAIPVRPHVHLNALLHIDIKPRLFPEPDLSDACRTDERLKPVKRNRSCWQHR